MIAQKRSERGAGDSRRESHHKRCPCCSRDDSPLASANKSRSESHRVDPAQANAIYERQVQWKRAKEANDSRLRSFYDELARLECTFKNPYYKDAWDTLSVSADVPEDANSAFFVRMMQWATQRETRLAQEKKIRDEIRLGECTFQPKLSPRRQIPSSSPRAGVAWTSLRRSASSPRAGATWMSPRRQSAGTVASASPTRCQDVVRAPYGCRSSSATTSRYPASVSTLSSPPKRSLVSDLLTTFAFPDMYDEDDLEELVSMNSDRS